MEPVEPDVRQPACPIGPFGAGGPGHWPPSGPAASTAADGPRRATSVRVRTAIGADSPAGGTAGGPGRRCHRVDHATVVGPAATGSALAPSADGIGARTAPAHLPGTGMAGEASFGPVSQVVRISVRTLSSRIDLVLPDRSTIAETLETVLELAPRSLREQAIAHGGWILRTAAGEAIPGSSTLLDQGIVDGATLFLTGIDAANSAAVYDDVADAIADAVLTDPSVWPAGAGRAVALGAAGLFGGLACLSLLSAGPPWVVVAVILGAIAVLGQVAAGLLVPPGRRRRRGRGGRAAVGRVRRRGGHRRHRG